MAKPDFTYTCPICKKPEAMAVFEEPIVYGCCKHCQEVIVKGDAGTFSALNCGVKYSQENHARYLYRN